MQHYHSFTEKGRQDLPSKEKLIKLQEEGIEPILFLDSCVCLDIVKVVNHKKNATNLNIQKVILLKKYISENNLKIRPMQGLMELCYENGNFNEDKYWDFRNRIKYFEEVPLKHFLKFDYDYNKEFFVLYTPEINLISAFNSLEYLFLNSYCCLLKIRALSLNGLSKNIAEKNVKAFFEWMSQDLGIILGIEYKLALNIFGGSSEYRKMIWLDGKKELVKKKLIGTSWDIFHARLCTNNFEFEKILGNRKIEGYLLTNDNILFNLHAAYGLTGIIEKSQDSGTMKIFNSDFNLPHFNDEFLENMNRKMVEEMTERFDKPPQNNVVGTRLLIKDLEIINNVV